MFKKYFGMATLVAVAAALSISSAAMAQSSTTPTPTAPDSTVPTAPVGAPPGHRGGFGLHSEAALAAAAEALGLTADDLQAQLWGGKTLADLADEKGVDIADVQAAVEQALIEETRAAIEQAVTDGTLTQDKADWLIEGLNAGYWGPGVKGDFGLGIGPGGRGGRHGFGGPMGVPPAAVPDSTTTPSSTAF